MSQQDNQPVAAVHVNENKVRVIAFLVLLLAITYLIFPTILIPVFLSIDFGLRAFDLGKYSLTAIIADRIIGALKWGNKPIFYPPKRFAARIGLVFSITILVFHFAGITAFVTASILAFFAALESLAGICAGCYVYNWLSPFWHKQE